MLATDYYNPAQIQPPRKIVHDTGNPWLSLAVAIVRQAAQDYERLGDNDCSRIDFMVVHKSEIRQFFRGAWFGLLTGWSDGIDPEAAIAYLDRRAARVSNT